MSLVQLRVELPTYAHSFSITVPDACTILDVKEEIARSCPGGPQVNGQRLVWRGRYLVDHEKVQDIWKSPDDPRVVHLAVHPSSWTSNPPTVPESLQTTPPSPPQLDSSRNHRHVTQTEHRHQAPSQPSRTNSLAYIAFKHQTAISALADGGLLNEPRSVELSRSTAMEAVARQGWTWPQILDENYPVVTEGGLQYERTEVDGKSYLSLRNPLGKPTLFQSHALKILSITFTLLSIPQVSTVTSNGPSEPINIPPHINQILEQLGLPDPALANDPNRNRNPNPFLPELREMPLRPLLAPFMMLIFRTLLLLYFVAPARKPVFGFLLLAWMLYEIWRPIRNGFLNGLRRANEAQQRNNPAGRQPQNQAAPAGAQQPGNGAAVQPQGPGGVDLNALFNTMANLNIEDEERITNQTPEAVVPEPGFGRKVITFLSLLVTTIHPGIWNRRRVALRRREGAIRTEASIRDVTPRTDVDGEDETRNEARLEQNRTELRAQFARRPLWVQRYMERVVAAEWVDDSD